MKNDDKVRSKFGIAICLRDMGNEKSRLFFDDVKTEQTNNPIAWKYNCFYTFTPEFNNNEIDQMNLTDEQFRAIGEAVVARLLALNGRIV